MKWVVPCGFHLGCHWYDKIPRVQVHLPEVHIPTITALLIIKGLKLHLSFHVCEAISYIPTCKQQGTGLGRRVTEGLI